MRRGTAGAPPLVILHGWRQTHEVMLPLAELLADIADLHLIDLPGFGGSPAPHEVWGTQDFADCILRYMDRECIRCADFIGHSFGGKTSLKIAAMRPERAGRLIIVDASGIPAVRPFQRRMKILAIRRLRSVLRALQRFGVPLYEKWFIPRFASPDYLAAGGMKNTFVRIVNEDLTAELPRITSPTLLLWGELDDDTPPAVGEKMSELIRGSDLVVLPGRGHYPFLGSDAQVCAYHIRKFLERTAVKQNTAVS